MDSTPRKTRSHLEYLHLQILSVVSGAQLRKIFEKRTNFDLRRLLGGEFVLCIYSIVCFMSNVCDVLVVLGAETFLHSLLSRLESDLAMGTSSLQCLTMDPTLRGKISDALIPSSKMKV